MHGPISNTNIAQNKITTYPTERSERTENERNFSPLRIRLEKSGDDVNENREENMEHRPHNIVVAASHLV